MPDPARLSAASAQDSDPEPQPLDAVIVGGGVAGLFTLDTLVRRGFDALLLESGRLGGPQSVAAQGIIHSGLKYNLDGSMSESAKAIRSMPDRWRASLEGRQPPDLTRTTVRAAFCYMWRTRSLTGLTGMLGARNVLRTKPTPVRPEDRPDCLRHTPGDVFRIDEQVIDPVSLLQNLSALHHDRIFFATDESARWSLAGTQDLGRPPVLYLHEHTLQPGRVILTAGNGTPQVRAQLGLDTPATQKRPLHMVMLRGSDLPWLNGHCVDGFGTRATITADRDAQGRVVWQIGGKLAEDGIHADRDQLLKTAAKEVQAVLPRYDLGSDLEWSAYRVDRAEGTTESGKKPAGITYQTEGAVLTAFPTKLALAPHLADTLADQLPAPTEDRLSILNRVPSLRALPRPEVAPAPWDDPAYAWTRLSA